MRTILAFILFTILSLSLFTNRSQAANPNAFISPDKLRHYVNLTFTNTKNVSKINYTLMYDTNTYQKGFEGVVKNHKSSRIVRRQILGTCSSRRCVYNAGVKNFVLEATFTLKTGSTTSITKNLP